MDFSALFRDPFLSDLDLVLVAADDGRELATYPVHGALLAGQSPYFKALLQSWTDARARRVELRVARGGEQAAAEMLLGAAYSGRVPADAAPEALLACMVLADRYQLRNCVDICRRAFHAYDASRLPWGAALALLHLPPGLHEAEAFSCLAEKAHQRVWADFHNLDVAFQRPPLRAAFAQLPRAAVERVVQSQDLRAVSENVVFLAVASWLRARIQEATGSGGDGGQPGGGGDEGPDAATVGDQGAAACSSGWGAYRGVSSSSGGGGAVKAGGSSSSKGSSGGGSSREAGTVSSSSAAGSSRASGGAAAHEAAADALQLLRLVRYPHLTANFLAAVAAHEQLLRLHPDCQLFLAEAAQYCMASEQQRAAMQADPRCGRVLPRAQPAAAAQSAFTSYISRDDLRVAISKYHTSGGRDAYYLLTEGHCWNGFTWRLKLTVKPPEPDSGVDLNVHVGLCWAIEIAGEALPLTDAAVVAVEFSIATHDFTTSEEDPTHSDSPVLIRAGTCWGWDDFFGRNSYGDLEAEWSKWMDDKGRMPLTCHIYSCA